MKKSIMMLLGGLAVVSAIAISKPSMAEAAQTEAKYMEDVLIDEAHFPDENFRKNDLTLEKTESMVYSCVDFRGKSLEAIRMETGLSREAVLTALLSLELMDLIEEKTRYYYRK